MKLLDILERKGRDLAFVLDEETVGDVSSTMADAGCGSVVVRTPAGSLVGIVNERAVVVAVAKLGSQVHGALARDIMLSPVPVADAQTSIIDAFKEMTRQRYRHLVVSENGLTTGIVSIGDLVKHYVHDIELENSVLRDLTAARIVERGSGGA